MHRESETSPFVFTTAGFARMIEWAAGAAGLDLKAHPHMLRHASGYALANRGHDTRAIQAWLGHRSITSSAVYTALAPNRFKDFWRDRSCQTLSRRPKPQPGDDPAGALGRFQ
jgi:site-specific recombinase XerD